MIRFANYGDPFGVLGLHTEQLGKKIVEVRRDLQDQRRFGLGVQTRRIAAGGGELRHERPRAGFVRRREALEEGGVEPG